MKSILGISFALMSIGVVLAACDTVPPAPSSAPQPQPAGLPLHRLAFDAVPLSGTGAVSQAQLGEALSILRKRLEIMELTTSTVELSGTSTLLVTIPTTADLEEATKILAQRGFIEFLNASSNPPSTGVYIVTDLGSPDPSSQPLDTSGVTYPAILTSEDLLIGGATITTQSGGRPDLQLSTTESGKQKLASYTQTHTGTFMPIALDKYVLVPPMIHGEITGGTLALAGLQDVDVRGILASVNSGVLPIGLIYTKVELIAPK